MFQIEVFRILKLSYHMRDHSLGFVVGVDETKFRLL